MDTPATTVQWTLNLSKMSNGTLSLTLNYTTSQANTQIKCCIKRDPIDGYYYLNVWNGKRYQPHSRHSSQQAALDKAEDLINEATGLLQPLED